MYDIVFYIDGHVNSVKFREKKEKFIFSKVIDYKDNIVKTAELARSLSTTKFFWLINIESDFLESMLNFKPNALDYDYTHVFKLSEVAECYLISKNLKENSQDYFYPVKYNNDFILPKKIGTTDQYSICFLSYNEPNSDKNWKKLKERFPHAARIYGEKNIYNSHKLAANSSASDYFWVVDADNEVLDNFNFDFFVHEYDFDLVHIWYSRNEINGLEYGNGGIKLFPKFLFDEEIDAVDITTSLSNKIKIIPTVASINRFASSPWNAWRSAFRECVKLSSGIISRSVEKENEERLKVWTTMGLDKQFGEYVIPGAISGMHYGKKNKNDKVALANINNWDWLHQKFKTEIKLPFRPE